MRADEGAGGHRSRRWLVAVLLAVVLVIGGFLVYRTATNGADDRSEQGGAISLAATSSPAGAGSRAASG